MTNGILHLHISQNTKKLHYVLVYPIRSHTMDLFSFTVPCLEEILHIRVLRIYLQSVQGTFNFPQSFSSSEILLQHLMGFHLIFSNRMCCVVLECPRKNGDIILFPCPDTLSCQLVWFAQKECLNQVMMY